VKGRPSPSSSSSSGRRRRWKEACWDGGRLGASRCGGERSEEEEEAQERRRWRRTGGDQGEKVEEEAEMKYIRFLCVPVLCSIPFFHCDSKHVHTIRSDRLEIKKNERDRRAATRPRVSPAGGEFTELSISYEEEREARHAQILQSTTPSLPHRPGTVATL
jgi:hypothetical protein